MNTASALGNGSEVLTRWSLRLLGGFELGVLPGGDRVTSLGKRERVLLAYLALSPNCRQPRRKLATLLWGDANDDTLLSNLRACVWKLRKALGDSEHRVVASEGEDIVLDPAAFEVDALAFRRLAAQSGRTELEAAAALCTGEFLDGLDIDSEEFESWRRAEAARYRDQSIDALNRLMTQLAECGETERATETGERILRLEPLHEAAARRLMQLYGESGRRGAAIQLYRTLAETLRTELDAQPEAETRAVFAEITHSGEEQANGHAAAEAKPPPRSASLATSIARPNDATAEPMRPPVRPPFRLRAPLAVLAGVAIVAAALISYRPFAHLGTPEGVVAERAAAADPASAISIAVLPFLNLSGDAGQEFFSDGMTEEITSALAMVPDLKVVARSSAFQFKGEKNDMRAVGQALNATHLIEGSVRKDGNRVRISAQLIEAGSGTHLWSENYDRELSDIFATQEEIARTVVGSLMAPLGLAPGERLVSNRSIDPESYQQYLRARALYRARAITQAIALLEPTVARDPNYAPAWALLAQAYAVSPVFNGNIWAGPIEEVRHTVQASLDKADMAAREAIRLDPRHAGGYVALAYIQTERRNWVAADDLFRQALALDSDDPEALNFYGLTLASLGRLKQALSMREQLRTLEPFVPIYNILHAAIMQLDGQNTAAIELLEDVPSGGAVNFLRNIYLARAYAAAGRYGDAADTLLAIPATTISLSRRSVEDAARLLRSAPAKVSAPDALPVLDPGRGDFVYAYIGAPNRLMEGLERHLEIGYPNFSLTWAHWDSGSAPLRKTERFKAYVRNAGLVEYWRARGWPDLCRPIGADDFVCD